MGLNNWGVASKVRKRITFKHFPIIGDFIDVPLTFTDVKIGTGGLLACLITVRQFPSDQVPQAMLACAIIIVFTLYLCWRPNSNPEKTNYDLIKVNLFKRRKRHFRKFSMKDIGRE
ncbi:hypothetical protein [Weissella minor]|uniref:hypothetical protein n=1 Tax=Weissella minor TaxID=1620 RepID=UPI003AF20425